MFRSCVDPSPSLARPPRYAQSSPSHHHLKPNNSSYGITPTPCSIPTMPPLHAMPPMHPRPYPRTRQLTAAQPNQSCTPPPTCPPPPNQRPLRLKALVQVTALFWPMLFNAAPTHLLAHGSPKLLHLTLTREREEKNEREEKERVVR